MKNNEIVIVGLVSDRLRKLVSTFDVQHLEDGEILGIFSKLQENHALAPAWMVSNLVRLFHDRKSECRLIVYQAPWNFLERQLKTTTIVPSDRVSLEMFTKHALRLWHAYYASLLRLHRERVSSSLLINDNRTFATSAVAAVVEERFDLKLFLNENCRTIKERDDEINNEGTWKQIVKAFAPECLDLYFDLESCAVMNEPHPEDTLAKHADQSDNPIDMLRLLYQRGKIDDLLGQHNIDCSDLVSRLQGVLNSHRELEKLAASRLEKILALTDLQTALQAEVARLLHQVSDFERNTISRQAETKGHSKQLHDLGNELKSAQAAVNDYLLQLREKEEEFSTQKSQLELLKKENELCLFQLHQVRDELGQYFKLNRQKDHRLDELQRHLNREQELSRAKDEKLVDIRKQLEQPVTSIVRLLAHKVTNVTKLSIPR